MAEKTFNTRIQLKYDSYSAWDLVKETFKPLKGEICIVNPGTNLSDATTVPCLAKVGDGEHFWKDLPWLSATAADVYAWGKAADVVFEDHSIKFKKADGTVVKTVTMDFLNEAEVNALIKTYVGDKANLTTTEKGTVVGAVNELDAEIGALSGLSTTNKGNLVAAINEVRQAVEVGGTGSVVTVVKDGDNTYKVKQGENFVEVPIVINDADLTLTTGEGIVSAETTFGANEATAKSFNVAHAVPTGAAAGPKDGITTDKFGHVTGVDLSAYAKSADLGDLAEKDTITTDLVDGFDTAVKAIKVDNAAQADAATKATQDGAGNNIVDTYATKTTVNNIGITANDAVELRTDGGSLEETKFGLVVNGKAVTIEGSDNVTITNDEDAASVYGLGGMVKIAVDGYTKSEANDKINEEITKLGLGSMSKKDAGDYYTKTEADEEFATPEEVIAEVNKALADVSNTDTITNITTLVEYVNNNAGDLTALIEEVYGSKEMTGDSRVDTAAANATAAVQTANSASGAAGEAKQLAEQAHTAATTAQNSASASAQAAATSEANALASKNAAAGSANAAAESAASAESWASAANSEKQEAIAAKEAAVAAQGAAESAASAAAASKANAATSETNAGNSASAAAGSASAAAASETNAGKAQTAAEAAKGAAETAQQKAEAAQAAAEAAQAAAEASNTSATAIANQAKSTADAASETANKASQDVAGLANIAKTGNVNDLIQTTGDVIIFNCGSSTVNV